MDLVENKKLEYLDLRLLQPAPRNARTHSKAQIGEIAQSIERFGWTNPILVDQHRNVIAGHGRLAAAKQLGCTEVPCLTIEGMSDAEKRAYMIADNKLALKAGWDLEILAGEFDALLEMDFDLSLTGFDLPEADKILAEAREMDPAPQAPEDDIPGVEVDAVTIRGDIWQLGRHRLICGDAKDEDVVGRLMAGEKAAMVFTDPPYNVPIDGHVSGLGRTKHREFAEASGEMSTVQFTEFLRASFALIEPWCKNGAIIYTCMDWRHMREILDAGHEIFTELKNICVWSKTNGGMGAFYRSQHEMVLVWKVGDDPHTNNFGLGDRGRYRTNVWTYAGVNTFSATRLDDLASHPTVKPVALVADAIRDVSHRGEIVLDSFGGSGTTLIAAEKTGRSARLVEIDPVYCDLIVRRWQRLTGKQAMLQGWGGSFEEIQLQRACDVTEGAEA